MVVKVEFEGQDTRNSTSKPKDSNRYFDAIYKEHFINSSTLKENRHNYGNEKMLIISKKDFMDEMQPFVEHKKNIGLKTEMVAVEDIGNNSDKIKEFIKSKYEADNQLTFVLLVGDYKQVTTPFAGGGGSDPSYSLISGNDNYPDVMIGRFSAETEQEVTNMVNKTIKYETAKKNNETWFKKGLGIASNDGNGGGDDNEYDWEHLRKIRAGGGHAGLEQGVGCAFAIQHLPHLTVADGAHGGQFGVQLRANMQALAVDRKSVV